MLSLMAPVAARLLVRSASPTVDLYLRNALGAAVGAEAQVRPLSPTVFAAADALVVVRHDHGAPVAPGDRRRLIYVLDDAVFEGLRDPTLPARYRLKLALVECAAARRLLPRADVLVVSTPEVAEALPRGLLRPGAEVVEATPYWSEAPAARDHHGGPGPFRVTFSGAQTHAAALRFVARAMAGTLRRRPEIVLHVARNHRPPGALRRSERLMREPATAWPAYRAALPAQQRHVALYPVAQTPFARARSVSKLIEHALMGAAPLYSGHWPRGLAAAGAGAGLALPADPAAWAGAVEALAAAPETARGLADGAAALAERLNDGPAQRALWTRLLGLAPA